MKLELEGQNKALPCGCIRGQYLCPKAVHLWDLVQQAYEEAQIGGQWEKYESARENYENHFEEAKE